VVSPAFADSTTGYKLKSRRDLGVKSFALGFGLISGLAEALEILVALGAAAFRRDAAQGFQRNLDAARVNASPPAGNTCINRDRHLIC
jgi:hypothetical protein